MVHFLKYERPEAEASGLFMHYSQLILEQSLLVASVLAQRVRITPV